MPAGKGTYGNKVGRPSNKRTGEDFLDREEKKKKRVFNRQIKEKKKATENAIKNNVIMAVKRKSS